MCWVPAVISLLLDEIQKTRRDKFSKAIDGHAKWSSGFLLNRWVLYKYPGFFSKKKERRIKKKTEAIPALSTENLTKLNFEKCLIVERGKKGCS